ncbi:MAG: hypothetical protein RLZZ267_1465 [Bacillota bacterium]
MHMVNHERIAIGILTMGDRLKGFRGNRSRFREWCMYGSKVGFDVFVIPHDGIDLSRMTVRAYRYVPTRGTWLEQFIDRPKIIYNRIPNRQDEQLVEVKRLLRSLARNKEVSLFNPRFFNKWTLIRWLIRTRSMRRYVPKSWSLRKGLPLAKLLRRYKRLYLKPVHGMAGSGIMVARLYRSRGDQYGLSKQMPTSASAAVKVSRFASSEAWRQAIWREIGEERYMLQQGIDLVRHAGRPFDLRLLLQKNRHGKWTVTGIGARVAGASSLTTHVPRGGSIANPAALLREALGRTKTTSLMRKLRKLAPRVARQIERASGDELGELSMDVGVDVSGKLWLFEANAKPMSFDEPAIHERALNNFFNYCRYLHNRNKARLQR